MYFTNLKQSGENGDPGPTVPQTVPRRTKSGTDHVRSLFHVEQPQQKTYLVKDLDAIVSIFH